MDNVTLVAALLLGLGLYIPFSIYLTFARKDKAWVYQPLEEKHYTIGMLLLDIFISPAVLLVLFVCYPIYYFWKGIKKFLSVRIK